jgi:hypothetical protein
MAKAIDCELWIQFEPKKHLHLGANYWKPDNRNDTYSGIYYDTTKQWSKLSFAEDVNNTDKMLVARIGLDKIASYCKGPVEVRIELGNETGQGWKDDQHSDDLYVDFSQ